MHIKQSGKPLFFVPVRVKYKKGKRPLMRSFSLKVCVYSIKEGKFANSFSIIS